MTTQEPVDLHADFVRNLNEAGNWPGLVRYWMAHRYGPALQQAVWAARRVRGPSGDSALAEFVAGFARAPLDHSLELNQELFQRCQPEEQATLHLCYLFPRLALCQSADEFPVEQQQELFQIGLNAIEQAKQTAARLQDDALVARLASVQATG